MAEAEKPLVAFEGNPDPQFAATWKSADGRSTYQLARDGTYKLDSKISVQGRAPFNSHLEGDWKVKDDRMLFRDKSGVAVPYAYELKGDTLTLSLTGSLKNKTILKKQ